jgi:hypothetical protein
LTPASGLDTVGLFDPIQTRGHTVNEKSALIETAVSGLTSTIIETLGLDLSGDHQAEFERRVRVLAYGMIEDRMSIVQEVHRISAETLGQYSEVFSPEASYGLSVARGFHLDQAARDSLDTTDEDFSVADLDNLG